MQDEVLASDTLRRGTRGSDAELLPPCDVSLAPNILTTAPGRR